MKRLAVAVAVLSIVVAACASGTAELEAELTAEVEASIDALNDFYRTRTAQIGREDMQRKDVTLAEFLAASEEVTANVDYEVLDSEAADLLSVVRRAEEAELATVNGASVSDIEAYAVTIQAWAVAEAPQGQPMLDCLTAVTANYTGDTRMSEIMADPRVLDCFEVAMENAPTALEAQSESNTYARRISSDWNG